MNELSQHTGQGEIILYQPDETVRLEVRLEDDTVWLTTNQMAVLFDREESNIRRHIINVFKEGELECARCYYLCWLSREISTWNEIPPVGESRSQRLSVEWIRY